VVLEVSLCQRKLFVHCSILSLFIVSNSDKPGQPGEKQPEIVKPLWDFRPRSETALTNLLLGTRDGNTVSPRATSPRDNVVQPTIETAPAPPVKTSEPENETDSEKKERLLLGLNNKRTIAYSL